MTAHLPHHPAYGSAHWAVALVEIVRLVVTRPDAQSQFCPSSAESIPRYLGLSGFTLSTSLASSADANI